MKKRSWVLLLMFFAAAWMLTTISFGAYFVLRAKCPAARAFFDSAGLDTNAITAYSTALAFAGFVVISLYQAHSSATVERELEEERRKTKRIQHDSMWLSVQIARLHSFSDPADKKNRDETREQIEEHWKKLSGDANQWK